MHYAAKASGSFDVVAYVDGVTSGQTAINVSQVKAGFDHAEAYVALPKAGSGQSLQLSFQTSADQPRTKLYAVTYGYHENEGVAR